MPLVEQHIKDHLEELSLEVSGVSRLWLHQANLNMNESIAKRVLGRKANQKEMPIVLNEYANTSSAGSLIAFHKNNSDISAGEVGVICSFGAGYSVGSVVLRKL